MIDHRELEARAEAGGGRARQAREHRLGRLLARERIDALLDAGTFVELGRYVVHAQQHSAVLASNRHLGDGLVCGLGSVAGRKVAVYAHDTTVLRGALGERGARKLCKLLDLARDQRTAVIALADSDGARILEGIDAVIANGEFLSRVARLRRLVPTITLAHGLCVGSAAYAAALTDLVGMVADRSFLFVTGPKVTATATGQQVDIGDLGGSACHASITGQCHEIVEDDAAGIAWVRRALSYLAPQCACDDPIDRSTEELLSLPLSDHRRAYDVHAVVNSVFDRGSVLETAALFAPNLVTGLARLGGRAVAYLANQPAHASGALDVNASLKGSRHLRMARAWGLPVVTLVDVPGFMPGRAQESAGLLSAGAEFVSAYADLETASVSLVLRKSYGGGSAMSFQADYRLALPDAIVAPTGIDALLAVEGVPNEERAQARTRWEAKVGSILAATESGYIDQIVDVEQVRVALAGALHGLL